jgi:hypothetical protein
MKVRLALAALFFPVVAAAAIVLGPERAVTLPTAAAAAGQQWLGSVASSGAETVVAWTDATPGRSGLYLAALSAEGKVIAGSQRRVAPAAWGGLALTWTGDRYLLLWFDGSGTSAMSLDRDLDTIAPPHVAVPGVLLLSNIRSNGDRVMMVYLLGNSVAAALLDLDGNAIRSEIAVPATDARSPLVASDGDSFFVFWRNVEAFPPGSTMPAKYVESTWAARFDAGGELRSPAMKLGTTDLLGGAWGVAFDGQHFALAFVERQYAVGSIPQRLQRLIVDPSTLHPTALPPVAIDALSGARVEWTGSRFVAYWTSYDSTHFSVESLAFTATAPGPATPSVIAAGSGAGTDAIGAWNGKTLVVAWTDRSRMPNGSDTDVYAATADANGVIAEAPSAGIPVALSRRWQGTPIVAYDGQTSLGVWTEHSVSDGRARLLAARATYGTIDTVPLAIADNVSESAIPAVVFTGSVYLVVWQDLQQYAIRIRRFDRAGAALDPEAISYDGAWPAVAWNGTHALVAFTYQGIVAVRFNAAGERTDAAPIVLAAQRFGYLTTVASNGSDFLVVWTEGSDWWQFPSFGLLDVFGVLVTDGGTATTPLPIATGPLNQSAADVASDGRDFVIAFGSSAEETVEITRIETKKLLREGVLSGSTADGHGAPIEEGTVGVRPSIAANGGGYLLAWEKVDETHTETRLGRLDPSGTLLESAAIASSPILMQPRLSAWPGGIELAYARIVDDPIYGASTRAFFRRLSDGEGRRRAVR